MMKVLHVIASLEKGGAEGVLFRLVMSSRGVKHVVVSLTREGHYGFKLKALGIEVHSLSLRRSRLTIRALLKLKRIIAEAKPDVVQTWMYHADLVAGLVARWSGIRAVVWGIRSSTLGVWPANFTARAAALICARLSHCIPAAIACCSEQAAAAHIRRGYRPDRFVVIPNGLDLMRFSPDASSRAELRTQWGIGQEDRLIGMVARWDPLKDHKTFLEALSLLQQQGEPFRCVLVGAGMAADNRELIALVRRFRLVNQLILAGPREDIPSVMNAIDLHVLSSVAEAFPNVIAEAMACGTPCVVTNVGDAHLIVGDTGWVVPPKSPSALAAAIKEALPASVGTLRDRLRSRCRKRVVDRFRLEDMVAAYEKVWRRVSST